MKISAATLTPAQLGITNVASRKTPVPPTQPVDATRHVTAQRTPIHESQIRSALSAAHKKLTGKAPTDQMLDVLTAHVGLETARGQRMFNYNFGGIKGSSPEGMTARYGTREVFNGEVVRIQDGFRAYGSAQDGATDYLNLMRTRFPDAIRQAERGDPDAFAHALKDRGYYTAPVETYQRAMRSLMGAPPLPMTSYAGPRRYAMAAPPPLTPMDVGGMPPLPSAGEVTRVLDAVASMSVQLGRPADEGEEA